jgi:hypothetical protein
MKGLRRNDDPHGKPQLVSKKHEIIYYSLLNSPLKPLPLLPVKKKRINNFINRLYPPPAGGLGATKINQGNEQLRIDGDFYPCAI